MQASGTAREQPAAVVETAERRRPLSERWQWLWVALASMVVFTVVTWPFMVSLGELWTVRQLPSIPGETAFVTPEGAFASGDHMQNIVIDSVVIENALRLREPYLDLREGVAGPEPLRTTSLNLPWTPLIGLLWPLVGLVTAYNLTLPLSTVVTALAAFGLLRRHTRWWLLAAAGALLYAFSTHRMYQLTVHFNAVMTWTFPAAVWAWEAALERWRANGRRHPVASPVAGRPLGRGWTRPAAALGGVILVVGVSGEYHLILYLAGLVAFLAAWALISAAARREPLPWALSGVAAGSILVACAYVLTAFRHAFRGTVAGGNGDWEQVLLYAPNSVLALVRKDFGVSGEGMIYLGLVVVGLGVVGLVVTLSRRLPTALPYAVLLFPLLLLTYGPAAAAGGFQPYRWAFEVVPFLALQRVPERIMVVTGLVVVLLAVVAVDALAASRVLDGPGLRPERDRDGPARNGDGNPAGNPAASPSGEVPPGRRRVAAVALAVVTLAVLADYQVSRNVMSPSYRDNAVVERLAADGDEAGPIVGLPVVGKTTTWNAGTTYVAALSRRHSLNAYNQTPAPWLDARLDTLAPLNRGKADAAALDVLRETGTRQVLVIDEPRMFGPGEWSRVISDLERSGHFRLVVRDAPFALLELTEE